MEKHLGYRFVDRLHTSRVQPDVVPFARSFEEACDACFAAIPAGEPIYRLRAPLGGCIEVCGICFESRQAPHSEAA